MNVSMKKIVWQQFGAAIDTMARAIESCPDDLWSDKSKKPQYWYNVYHTLFFLDFYLSDSTKDFKPPEPFTLSELDPSGLMPDRIYSKDEMMNYLMHGRKKCRATIETMTAEGAKKMYKAGRIELPRDELMLYIMRHVQHHAAQLNLMLRQTIDSAPGWVFRANND